MTGFMLGLLIVGAVELFGWVCDGVHGNEDRYFTRIFYVVALLGAMIGLSDAGVVS